MNAPFKHLIFSVLLLCSAFLKAQTGLEVTPPRNYFGSAAGESSTKKIIVTNSSKTSPLTLTVSFSDWQYDDNGNNIMANPGTLPNSCSNWISVQPQSYFSLGPGESKEIEVTVTPPSPRTDTLNVHTAMLYITQTNPIDSYNEHGALIKVSLRNGVKIYHRYNNPSHSNVEFTDFKFDKKSNKLELSLDNKGNIWTDGPIATELINQSDGKKYQLEDQIIYTLPGDQRSVPIPLPKDLKPGKYIATSTFSYGDDDMIKMAELTFIHE
ncbi:molecular chaperone [Chryseobacterium sp. MDT2-18]|uniref:fimbrial biogenesis chaperone n=1 Tax=Chryseobacterium sp. MDT2-18 TaxID=1259136 RepID=UPI0027875BC1|nr:molecular chaperone [Chryseobacterium sp. MDT2-18]MDQ0477956.1 P pilus assembly chaperone PapD [Chryseobacterium sp. MDT2-18]